MRVRGDRERAAEPPNGNSVLDRGKHSSVLHNRNFGELKKRYSHGKRVMFISVFLVLINASNQEEPERG